MNLDQVIYFVLLVSLGLQRISELVISKRNQRLVALRGGVERAGHQYPWMILIHLTWFFICFWDGITASFFAFGAQRVQIIIILIFCQWVRWQSIYLLGDRWTTRIYVVPGEPTVKEGIYSWIRHPNYFVVAIELALFPLLSWSWTTSFVFTILNGTLLWFRIRSEEQALLETSDYRDLQEVAKRFHFF